MAKYSHPFRFVRRERLSFFYASPGWDARLDFLESGLLRVAVIPQGIRLLPSWSVQPGAPTPREGRSRLSMEGFSPAWAVPEDTRERTAFPLVFPSRPFPGASRSQPASAAVCN